MGVVGGWKEEKEIVQRLKLNAVMFTGHMWMHSNLVF